MEHVLGGLAVTLAVLVAAAVAGPAAAHGNDLDPSDGDVHLHEEERVEVRDGHVEAGANVTCSADDVPEPCSASVSRSYHHVCFNVGTVKACVP